MDKTELAILKGLSESGGVTATHGQVVPKLVQPTLVTFRALLSGIDSCFSISPDELPELKTPNGEDIELTGVFRDKQDAKIIKLLDLEVIILNNLSIWESYVKNSKTKGCDTVSLFENANARAGNGVFRYPQMDVVDQIVLSSGQKMRSNGQCYMLLTCNVAVKGEKTAQLFKDKLVRFCYNGQIKSESMADITSNLSLIATVINDKLKKHELNTINLSNLRCGIELFERTAGDDRYTGFKMKDAKSDYTFAEAYKFAVDKNMVNEVVVPALKKAQQFVAETKIYKVVTCQSIVDKTGKLPVADSENLLPQQSAPSLTGNDDIPIDAEFDDDAPF